MSFKKVILKGLLISMSSLPLFAHAADLTLINNTNFDSTSKMNGSECSTSIPNGGGVTKAHTTNTVKALYVILACRANRANCTADVYLSNNCTGNNIATVVIDSNQYVVKSVTMNSADYHISVNGFGLTLDGGPKMVSKK